MKLLRSHGRPTDIAGNTYLLELSLTEKRLGMRGKSAIEVERAAGPDSALARAGKRLDEAFKKSPKGDV